MLLKIFLQLLFIHSLVLCSSSEEGDTGSTEKEGAEPHPKAAAHGHWGYEDQDQWSAAFSHCSGNSQSPINIDTKSVIHDATLPSIVLEGYDLKDASSLILLNNGHTLQLSLPNSMRIVSGFDQVYLAAQLHFHWGTVEVPGSEHTVDNIHFPAEIHIVHYNSKYANLSEAANKPDGLAVLGGYIGVGLHENANYEKILSALTDISTEESKTQIPGFNVRHLLPKSLKRFYRYYGSLTTPPCFQSVNWTVFNDTITVSRRQLAALEDTLKMGLSQQLNKNFRAPQALNGRRVLASFTDSIIPEGRGSVVPVQATDTEKKHTKTSSKTPEGLSKGDILAIAFGTLFGVTLLLFTAYAYQQRKKYPDVEKDPKHNVIYKPATKEEV